MPRINPSKEFPAFDRSQAYVPGNGITYQYASRYVCLNPAAKGQSPDVAPEKWLLVSTADFPLSAVSLITPSEYSVSSNLSGGIQTITVSWQNQGAYTVLASPQNGTIGIPSFQKLNLATLAQSGATLNQVPQWNGSAWAPATVGGGGGGITSINLLTAAAQSLVTGTAGTDFNIVSSVATHTFNLPIASATKTGKLSSTDWDNFNNKLEVVQIVSSEGTINCIDGSAGTVAAWDLDVLLPSTQIGFGSATGFLDSTSDFIYDPVNKLLTVAFSGASALSLDQTNGLYKFGDLHPVGNNGFVALDDANNTFDVSLNGGSSVISLSSGSFTAVASVNESIGVSSTFAGIRSGGVDLFYSQWFGADHYAMIGDTGTIPVGNGTYFRVDDTLQKYKLSKLYATASGGSPKMVTVDASGFLGAQTIPSGSGTVTSIATAGLISGGTITTTGTITTSMNTGKLVGRSTAGTGIMEEITVGSGLSLAGGTLSASGGSGKDYFTFVVGFGTDVDYQVDGTADDVQINAAIAALPASGGKIILREGAYSFAAPVVVNANNVGIEGMGTATSITIPNGTDDDVFQFTAQNGHLANVFIDGNGPNQTSGYGVSLSATAVNVRIEQCSITNTCRSNVYVDNGTDVTVINCLLDTVQNGCNVEMGSARNVAVGNNTCLNAVDASISVTGSRGGSIAGNVCSDSAGRGIVTELWGGGISGNSVYDCLGAAFYAGYPCQIGSNGIYVSGNPTEPLIILDASDPIGCTGNEFVVYSTNSAPVTGIVCQADRMTITGNTLQFESAASVAHVGIDCNGRENVTVSGNMVVSYQIAGTGITTGAGFSGTISGNTVNGFDTAILITGAENYTVANNAIELSNYGIKAVNTSVKKGLQINGNNLFLLDKDGISLQGVGYSTVSDNIVAFCGQGTTNTYSGILLTSTGTAYSTYNAVHDNNVFGNLTKKLKYGIRENSVNESFNQYAGNVATDAVTADLSIQGTNSVLVDLSGGAFKTTLGNGDYMELDPTSSNFHVFLDSGNTYIDVDGAAENARIQAGNTTFTMEGAAADRHMHWMISGRHVVHAQWDTAGTRDVSLGDKAGADSGTYIDVDDTNQRITLSKETRLPYSTASRAAYFDANKALQPSATTDTELGYVSGVTSSIQTQLNARPWELVSAATASNSATIDFTGLSAAYSTYVIMFTDVVAGTNAVALWARVGTGATPTYQSGAADYAHVRSGATVTGTGTSAASFAVGGGNDNQIILFGAAVSSTTTSTASGQLWVYNPSQATAYHHLEAHFTVRNSAVPPNTNIVSVAGTYLSTTAVTAVRMMLSSGNIASGSFKLYGIK